MSARAWTIFAAVSTLWGIPYLFIKLAVNGGVTPGVLAWGRITLAAIVLLALARRSGSLRGLRGRWRWLALYAIVEVSIPFPLIAAGEQHISSSLAAIIIATVPLLVALLALRFDPAETATGRRLVGLFVGLVGVIVLVGIDAAGNLHTLLGAGAVLIAVALGVTLLGEQPGAGAVAGLLLILAGSWLSTDGRLPPGLTRMFRAGSATAAPLARRALRLVLGAAPACRVATLAVRGSVSAEHLDGVLEVGKRVAAEAAAIGQELE